MRRDRTIMANIAKTRSARDFVPARLSLPQLRKAAAKCKALRSVLLGNTNGIRRSATHASAMFVGEQPGDQEDLAGKPFVGPSGKLLDSLLDEVGIDRVHDIYVTNAIKHFKFESRGKRRIHSKPSAREIAACRPWLEAEIQIVQPKIIVALGSNRRSNAPRFSLPTDKTSRPGYFRSTLGPWMLATYHPSAVLRMPDEAARREARMLFKKDLQRIADQIARTK